MRRLSERLTYVWTPSLFLGKGQGFIDRIQGRSGWCPMLVFTKGRYEAKQGFVDVVLGVEKEKDHHEWQQTLAESKRFLEVFSEPDDLVCDPCGGSFTNAVGALLAATSLRRMRPRRAKRQDWEAAGGRGGSRAI